MAFYFRKELIVIERLKVLLKPVQGFILMYYNSLLYCTISAWLAYTLFTVGHWEIGAILISIVIVKIIGLILHNHKLRQIGIIGLNVMWALNTYVFISYHPTVELSFHFPLFILFLGVGISLRGRFDE